MKKHLKHILVPGSYLFLLLSFLALGITASDRRSGEKKSQSLQELPIQIEGIYYCDSDQNKLYNGPYREYFENGDLKMEMYIVQGKPDDTYVVYYSNAKIKEVRSYLNGVFNGIWRSYSEQGVLMAQAEYLNGMKHGLWRIWDEQGTLRYEMQYDRGKKTGNWSMWDESGKLISERKYD